MPKRKETEGGTDRWTSAAATKLKDKSVSDLTALAIAQYVSDEENSEMVFQASLTALKRKSQKAYRKVFDRLAEMNDSEPVAEIAA